MGALQNDRLRSMPASFLPPSPVNKPGTKGATLEYRYLKQGISAGGPDHILLNKINLTNYLIIFENQCALVITFIRSYVCGQTYSQSPDKISYHTVRRCYCSPLWQARSGEILFFFFTNYIGHGCLKVPWHAILWMLIYRC